MVTAQKIRKEFEQVMDFAMAYYSIISAINKLQLTERELQLIAFTAIRGGITNPAAREDFCQMYSTSQATINNLISKLRKLGLFIKEQNKTRVHPALALDFSSPTILLQISLQKTTALHEQQRTDD